MRYIAETGKSIFEAAQGLETAIRANGFGILHVHDLKKILQGKGIDLPQECRIYEICNPLQASETLAEDMEANLVLPCRISVWQDQDGAVKIGMLPPRDMLHSLAPSPALKHLAADVEEKMKMMIWAAK